MADRLDPPYTDGPSFKQFFKLTQQERRKDFKHAENETRWDVWAQNGEVRRGDVQSQNRLTLISIHYLARWVHCKVVGLGSISSNENHRPEVNLIKLLQVYFTSVAIVSGSENDSYTCKSFIKFAPGLAALSLIELLELCDVKEPTMLFENRTWHWGGWVI